MMNRFQILLSILTCASTAVQRLKLKHAELIQNFAFDFNLCLYKQAAKRKAKKEADKLASGSAASELPASLHPSASTVAAAAQAAGAAQAAAHAAAAQAAAHAAAAAPVDPFAPSPTDLSWTAFFPNAAGRCRLPLV